MNKFEYDDDVKLEIEELELDEGVEYDEFEEFDGDETPDDPDEDSGADDSAEPRESRSKTKDKGKWKKSIERINKEKEFADLYEQYMHPAEPLSLFREQCLLSDMFMAQFELNKSWAFQKAERYKSALFGGVDAEIALSVGCEYIYDRIREDKAAGHYVDKPTAYYMKMVKYESIDNYFRKVFGRMTNKRNDEEGDDAPAEEQDYTNRKLPAEISLESKYINRDGEYHEDRYAPASCDPFSVLYKSRRERDAKANHLTEVHFRNVLNYTGEPQKVMALMYGSIMYQLAKETESVDPYAAAAAKSTRVTSAAWAHKRMGYATMQELSDEAERTIQYHLGKNLSWGSAFRQKLEEKPYCSDEEKWGDVVYTKTFVEHETTRWIESIMKSMTVKLMDEIKNDPELREYSVRVMGYKTKFRKILDKVEKEDIK